MEYKQEFLPLSNPEYGQKQIDTVYEELENMRRDCWKKITDIIKDTKMDESIANESNIERHNKRLEELRRLDEEIPKKQLLVEERVNELLEVEQADLLKQQFDELKEQCNRILYEKNTLILEFQKELSNKDHQYISSLHKFKTDTTKIIKLMREMFINLRDKMLELIWNKDNFNDGVEDATRKLSNFKEQEEKKNCIEGEFLRDRSKLLGEYNNNIRTLMKKLENAEKDFAYYLTKMEDEKEAENEKEAFKEETRFINKIIVMEKFFNILKEQIEDFTYELKILLEMLEYRVEVREEKIKENKEKKEQYTKWRDRMKVKISKSLETYKNIDENLRSENIALKLDFIKTTESFDDLKKKFRHFESYDEEQFMKIYNMKFQESKNIAIKVLLADRTIKSQQLGFEVISNDNADGFTLEELQNTINDEEDNSLKKLKPAKHKKKVDSNFKSNFFAKIPFDRVKEVFSLIIQEAEFLIDIEVLQKYGDQPLDTKLPYMVESICKSLQIKNENELNQLLDLFDKKSIQLDTENENLEDEIENAENKDGSDEEKDSIDKKENKLNIDPDKVIDYLKEFYEERKKNSKNESKRY